MNVSCDFRAKFLYGASLERVMMTMMMMGTMTSYSALSIPGMRVLFCPTSLVRTKLSNFRTDLGRRLHFSYGPLRAKERYLIPTFPPFLIAKTPTFCLVVKLFCLVSDLIILFIPYLSIFFVIPQSVHFFLSNKDLIFVLSFK